MSRNKLKLAFIENNAKRRATYKKRLTGFMKKVSQLSILCAINVCAIVYGPNDLQPEVWPSTSGVEEVISQFLNMPGIERSKNMVDQEKFLKKMISKVNEQLKKLQKENRDNEITELMLKCLFIDKRLVKNSPLPDLNDLGEKINQKLMEINRRLVATSDMATPQQSAPPPPLPPLSQPVTPIVTNNQMPRQEQSHFPQSYGTENPGFGLGGDYQLMMPVTNNGTTTWANVSYNLMPSVTNTQIQLNKMQAQEHNHFPQPYGNWMNNPLENMGFCLGGDDQCIMPFTNNATTTWANASFNLMPIVTNTQIQPNEMQAQEQNYFPQLNGGCTNNPIENMEFGPGGKDQLILPFTNNVIDHNMG